MSNSLSQRDTRYSIGKAGISVLGAVALIMANIAVMVLIAPTAAAEAVLWMYQSAPFAPWFGLIVMSLILSLGRYVGYNSLGYDAVNPEDTRYVGSVNTTTAVLGLLITQLAFGLFGGAALAIVSRDLWITVIGISAGITAAIAIVAGSAELMTKRDLAPVGYTIHIGGIIVGVVLLFLGRIIGAVDVGLGDTILMVAFLAILISWIGDMLHEISILTRDDRTIALNAFGLYVAITGVFVHILWIVARAYAEN